jgi:hypothetical protein
VFSIFVQKLSHYGGFYSFYVNFLCAQSAYFFTEVCREFNFPVEVFTYLLLKEGTLIVEVYDATSVTNVDDTPAVADASSVANVGDIPAVSDATTTSVANVGDTPAVTDTTSIANVGETPAVTDANSVGNAADASDMAVEKAKGVETDEETLSRRQKQVHVIN